METIGLSEGPDLVPPQDDYAEFDFNRPPFRFPTREPYYSIEPLYPEIDDTWIFEMEDRVFHPRDPHFPKPPENLHPHHPLSSAYIALLESEKTLFEGMNDIKSLHYYFKQKLPESVQSITKSLRELLGMSSPKETERERERLKPIVKLRMREHLREKREYFQRALAYLYLYKYCPETEADNNVDILFDEVEAIYIAHLSYTLVRSATHKYRPRRKSGDLVMNHVYHVCVHGINRHIQRIKNTNNPNEKKQLYYEMKVEIIRSLCHDYLEDFDHLSTNFLANKIQELLNFDTIIESDIQMPKYGTPEDTNFCSQNREIIILELLALIKTEGGEADLIHLIFENLPEESRLRTFQTKLADRLNNLKTLAAMPIDKQVRKIVNTVVLLLIGIWACLRPEYKSTDLAQELINVGNAAIQETNRLFQNFTDELKNIDLFNILESASTSIKETHLPALTRIQEEIQKSGLI